MKRVFSFLLCFSMLCSVTAFAKTGAGDTAPNFYQLSSQTAEQNNLTFLANSGEVTYSVPETEASAYGVGSYVSVNGDSTAKSQGVYTTFDKYSTGNLYNDTTSCGTGYNVEVAFDFRPDRSDKNDLKFNVICRGTQADTLNTTRRIVQLKVSTAKDYTSTISILDRSGNQIGAAANLSEVLGSYTADADHFYRVRIVFTATETKGTALVKVYVDGHEITSGNLVLQNTEKWIAGLCVQNGGSEKLVDIDNLSVYEYNGERKYADGTENINDDRTVAAIRSGEILLKTAPNDDITETLKTAVETAKAEMSTATTQSGADAVALSLEKAMADYSEARTLENFVLSDYIDEALNFITKDLSLPENFLPATGGIFDCSFTSSKPNVISHTGKVTRPKYNEVVILTANLTRDTDGTSLKKTFTVRVLADGTVNSRGNYVVGNTYNIYPSAYPYDTYGNGKRTVIGGFAQSAPVNITLSGGLALTVLEAGEFSVILDLKNSQVMVCQNGKVEDTKALTGSGKQITTDKAISDVVIVYSDASGYEVTKLNFTDADGNSRNIPVANGKLASVDVAIKDDTLENTKMVSAVYQGDTLYDIAFADLAKGDFNEILTPTLNLDLPKDVSNITIKQFFWKDLDNVEPLCVPHVFNVAEEVDFRPAIYLAGDSTCASYGDYNFPQQGWGKALENYFDMDNIVIHNHAKGGRSAKSFVSEGRLNAILNEIKPGDILIVQFGHNDKKADDPYIYTEPQTTYKAYMQMYIDGAKAKGATPILATSITRRIFDDDGTFQGVANMGGYPEACREMAKEQNLLLIELFDYSVDLVNRLGTEDSKDLYLHVAVDDARFNTNELWANSKYNKTEATVDNSHFTQYGAETWAKYAAEALRDMDLPVSAFYTEYTPVKP